MYRKTQSSITCPYVLHPSLIKVSKLPNNIVLLDRIEELISEDFNFSVLLFGCVLYLHESWIFIILLGIGPKYQSSLGMINF